MTEKTHYKESPYDERIEELALDIEAAKGKANKRESFWRSYAVVSAVIIFALVAWGMKEAGTLWHETLGVAKLQEERAADTLEQSGKQAQKLSQVRADLAAMEEEVQLWKANTHRAKAQGLKLAVYAKNLLKTLRPNDSTIPMGKPTQWIAALTSGKKKDAAQRLLTILRNEWELAPDFIAISIEEVSDEE